MKAGESGKRVLLSSALLCGKGVQSFMEAMEAKKLSEQIACTGVFII